MGIKQQGSVYNGIFICVLTNIVNNSWLMKNYLYFCAQNYSAMLFQYKLKELRESHNLLQRQVAAGIDMDTAVYCKIEKGNRQAREEQVRQLAFFYGISYEELRRYWLAGKVYSLVEEEDNANRILCLVAEEMGEYGKSKNKNKDNDGKD